MSKRKVSDADIKEWSKQIKSLRKKLRRLKKETDKEVIDPPTALVRDRSQEQEENKENGK